MAGKDIINMSQKELQRLHVIRKILDRKLKQVEGSKILGLSDRQVRRIVKKIREFGDRGIVHQLRGEVSNRILPHEVKEEVKEIYKQKYSDFGPKFANEKLLEIDKIRISNQTLRNWLISWGYWQVKDRRKKHRQWRERKHYFGEMIQMDGSHHDWFEGRGPGCVLMGYIDDATSNVYGRFYEYEGTVPALDSLRRYIKRYGFPASIYLDRHTTYKSPAKPSMEDELNNVGPLTQFGRALRELGVDLKHANSPQAKGRVERLFKTLQDRLTKEMRLKGISNIDEANKFLEYYLPRYNKQFSVKSKEKVDLHRSVPQGFDIDGILCIKAESTLRNDFTIAYKKRFYQILDHVNTQKVIIEERVNGKMIISYKGNSLKYKEIFKEQFKKKIDKINRSKTKRIYIPEINHPWKIFDYKNYSQKEMLLSQT